MSHKDIKKTVAMKERERERENSRKEKARKWIFIIYVQTSYSTQAGPETGTCRACLHILNMNLLNNFKIPEGEKLTDFNGEIVQ